MSTTSVYADTTDGYVFGADFGSDYSAAHATSLGSGDSQTASAVGQVDFGDGEIDIYCLIFPFTLALGVGAVISAAELRFTRAGGSPTRDFNIRCHRHTTASTPLSGAEEANYDGRLVGGGAVDEGQLAANVLAGWTVDTDKTRSVDPASVNPNGTTYYVLLSEDDIASTAPLSGDDQLITVYMADHATAGKRPQLTVTYTIASGTSNVTRGLFGRPLGGKL